MKFDAARIRISTHSNKARRWVANQLVETFGARVRDLPPLQGAKDPNELATRPHAKAIFAKLVSQADG